MIFLLYYDMLRLKVCLALMQSSIEQNGLTKNGKNHKWIFLKLRPKIF